MKPYEDFLREKVQMAYCKAMEQGVSMPTLFDLDEPESQEA